MTRNGSKRSDARVRWQVPVGAASLCLALGGVGMLLNSGGGSLPEGIQSEAVAAALTEARATSAPGRESFVMELPSAEPSIAVTVAEESTPEPTPETRVLAASSAGIATLAPPPPVPTSTPTLPPTVAPTSTPTPSATPARTPPPVEPTAPVEVATPGTLIGPDGIQTNEPKGPPLSSGGAAAPSISESPGLLK